MSNAAPSRPLAHPKQTSSVANIVLPLINVAAVIGLIAANVISQAIPLNGQTNAQISDRYTTLFTPAGFAFSIWGLIWLGLIGFAIYQISPTQRHNPVLRGLTLPFVISCAGNISWIVFFSYNQFALSVVAIGALLLALIVIYVRLDTARGAEAPGTQTNAWRWLVKIPFSVYLGWVSVATIADVALTLVAADWHGGPLPETFWTVAMLLAGGVLGAIFLIRHRDTALVFVLVWAYTAIVSKQSATPVVAGTAAVLVVFFLIGIVATWISGRRVPQTQLA